MAKFKKGAFHTAKDLGYPIVPFYYENAFHLAPGSSSYFKNGTVRIHIHEPISTVGWTNENLDEKIAEVRGLYLKWLKEYDGEVQTE